MIYTISKKLGYALLAMPILAGLFSCKTPEKYIVNSWKIEKFQAGIDFSASPEHMEILKDFEKHAWFEFNNDGTYNFDLAGTIQKGKWVFNKKEMTIITTDENGKTTISKVLELKPERLVIQQDEQGVNHILTLVPKEAS